MKVVTLKVPMIMGTRRTKSAYRPVSFGERGDASTISRLRPRTSR